MLISVSITKCVGDTAAGLTSRVKPGTLRFRSMIMVGAAVRCGSAVPGSLYLYTPMPGASLARAYSVPLNSCTPEKRLAYP